MKYVLSIDQGTTGTKAVLVDEQGQIVNTSYQAHTQHHPQPGWVEHDVEEIWQAILDTVASVLEGAGVRPADIVGVAVANQGETVVPYSRSTGRALHHAIVWSDRRTDDMAQTWAADSDWAVRIAKMTGLRIDPYFSGTKMKWLLENVDAVREALMMDDLCLSTLDAWMIYRMSGGHSFVSDVSTASRTLLFDIHTMAYSSEVMEYLGIPRKVLPDVVPTAGVIAHADPSSFLGIEAPIVTSVVDQPAALFGQLCLEPGQVKCTYGTGCFLYMNIGDRPAESEHGMLTTLVWNHGQHPTFAFDGGVYSAGSAVDWLRQIGVAEGGAHAAALTASVHDTGDVWFVPALTGLAAPYWDSNARGAFVGLSSATERAHLARAVFEGIAHRVADVAETMALEAGTPITSLRVDGGLTNAEFLMQFQADILGVPIEVSEHQEATALGAAYMAGIHLGLFSEQSLATKRGISRRYEPSMTPETRRRLRSKWRELVPFVQRFGGRGE